jgi:hypothetical protein
MAATVLYPNTNGTETIGTWTNSGTNTLTVTVSGQLLFAVISSSTSGAYAFSYAYSSGLTTVSWTTSDTVTEGTFVIRHSAK